MTLHEWPGSIAGGQTSVAFTGRAGARGRGAILVSMGRGADPTQALTEPGLKAHLDALADDGRLVLACDAGGTAPWWNPASMAAITDAYTYARTTLGADLGLVGLVGWSMGGGEALQWTKENPSLVGAVWCFAPATDLDHYHADPTYGPEIDVAYPGTYPASAAGHRIANEPQSWAGVCPIRIAHATDDVTTPYAQSQAFVAAVGDPQVTLRTVPSGGHVGVLANVPTTETVAFFDSHL